jgi:hypothetical protein
MQYLIESAICLAVFYAFYWLALRRETFFQWNRWYLLLAPFLAFVIPAVQISLEKKPVVAQAPALDLPMVVEQTQNAPLALQQQLESPVGAGAPSGLTLGSMFCWIYMGVAVLLVAVLIIRLWKLIRFIQRCRKNDHGDFTLAQTPDSEPVTASFFSFVFWNHLEIRKEERLIVEHELVHARQWHSLDVLFMEALVIWQWFNPLVYLYKKSLQAVHEYIADDYVVRTTRERSRYAELLAQQYRNQARPGLFNTFHSQFKSRLIMLAKHPSRNIKRAKFALAFPLAFGLMLLFSFRLIERMPLAAPIKHALKQVELYTGRLAEVEITGTKASPAVLEPSPYILYWGIIQAKMMHETNPDRYVAEVHTSPAEFREAIKREPRLWTGQTLEQHFSFVFREVDVRSNYYETAVYETCRKQLEQTVGEIKDGDQFKISKIPLPDGKSGEVELVFDKKDPNWLPKDVSMPMVGVHVDQPNPVVSSKSTSIEWGDNQYSPVDRQFCTVNEFWKLMEHAPKLVKDKTVYAPEYYLFSVTQGIYGRHLLSENPNTKSFDSLSTQMETMRKYIEPGTRLWIKGTDPKGVDEVHLMDPASTVFTTPASLTLGSFEIVPDGDPRLNLNYKQRHDYLFEWGNYSSTIYSRYAVSYKIQSKDSTYFVYPDQKFELVSYKYTRAEILQMLTLPVRLFKEKELLHNVRFLLTCKDKSTEVKDGVCPPDMLEYLRLNLKPQDVVRITQLSADGADLHAVVIKLEVKSDNPKPPLRVPGKSADGTEQKPLLYAPAPNPASDRTQLKFFLPQTGPVNFQITNNIGQKVWSQSGQFDAGENTLDIDLGNISGKGLFIISMQTTTFEVQEQKLIIR